MSYSVALKTNSKEQSIEILNFIKNNVPQLTTVFPQFDENCFTWIANDLSYIADYPHIGFNFSCFDYFTRTFTYTMLYQIALKFNLQTIINDIPVVVLDYDSEYTFYLAEKNPFSENDPRHKGFVRFKDGIILDVPRFILLKKLFHLTPNKKEIKKIQEIIKNIHNY